MHRVGGRQLGAPASPTRGPLASKHQTCFSVISVLLGFCVLSSRPQCALASSLHIPIVDVQTDGFAHGAPVIVVPGVVVAMAKPSP